MMMMLCVVCVCVLGGGIHTSLGDGLYTASLLPHHHHNHDHDGRRRITITTAFGDLLSQHPPFYPLILTQTLLILIKQVILIKQLILITLIITSLSSLFLGGRGGGGGYINIVTDTHNARITIQQTIFTQ